MKLIKISGYLIETDGQTKENVAFFLNSHFDTKYLRVEESEIFEDGRVLEPDCKIPELEKYFEDDSPLICNGDIWRHSGTKDLIQIINLLNLNGLDTVFYMDNHSRRCSQPLDDFLNEFEFLDMLEEGEA